MKEDTKEWFDKVGLVVRETTWKGDFPPEMRSLDDSFGINCNEEDAHQVFQILLDQHRFIHGVPGFFKLEVITHDFRTAFIVSLV